MRTRSEFARQIANLELSHTQRAIALLWYYRQSQEYDERSASELAADLHEEDFPRPNVTRLRADLGRSRFTIKGKRPGTFQIDVRRLEALDEDYGDLLEVRRVEVAGSVLPTETVAGTRVYLERLVHQINGCYEYGFYDACAVLCRRLMETLIIEVYMSQNRQHEIQTNGVFRPLEGLIAYMKNDNSLALTRGISKTMDEIKQIGDAAAHDRAYITHQSDIADLRTRYRRMISELLNLSGIR